MNIRTFLIAIAASCTLGMSLPATSFAQEYGLMTIPAHEGNRSSLDFGLGYDLRTQKAKLRSCVTFKKKKRTLDDGDESQSFSFVSSRSQVAEAKGMSASAKAGATFGGWGASASGSTSKSSKHAVHGSSQAIMARKVIIQGSKMLKVGSVELKDKYVKMLQDPKTRGNFTKDCGDALVLGLQKGAEFYGLASLTKSASKSSSKKKKKGKVSGGWGPFSASVSASSAKKKSSAIADSSLLISIEGTGAKGKNPTSLKGLVKAYRGFNKKGKAKRRLIKAHLAAYSEVVENWPIDEDFFRPVAEENLGIMMDTLWDLNALTDEAAFISNNPTLFALGTQKSTRLGRVKNVKKLKKEWDKKLKRLKPKAEKCFKSGEEKDCKLKGFSLDMDKERARLPERYDALCSEAAAYIWPNKYAKETDGKKVSDFGFQNPTRKGKKKKGQKSLKWKATGRIKNGRYNLDLKVEVRKHWKKNSTIWNNHKSALSLVSIDLNDKGLGSCRFASGTSKKVEGKDQAGGKVVAAKNGGIRVSCNSLGKKKSPNCIAYVLLAEAPLPTVHEADLTMERRYGKVGKGKRKLKPLSPQEFAKKRLKRVKAKRKLRQGNAAKKRKALKSKRKKARNKAKKSLKKRKRCKKGKKGKKCRAKRKKNNKK